MGGALSVQVGFCFHLVPVRIRAPRDGHTVRGFRQSKGPQCSTKLGAFSVSAYWPDGKQREFFLGGPINRQA